MSREEERVSFVEQEGNFRRNLIGLYSKKVILWTRNEGESECGQDPKASAITSRLVIDVFPCFVVSSHSQDYAPIYKSIASSY